MDTDSLKVYIKTEYVYVDTEKKTRFDTSNYELDKTIPKGKNEKLIGLMKDELYGKIMTESPCGDIKSKAK